MSRETRKKQTFETVEENQAAVQQAANVVGMPQFNNARTRISTLETNSVTETGHRQQADDAEAGTRAAADTQHTSDIAANTAADATRATTQASKDSAQDSALQSNAAADATRVTAQTQKDTAQDTAQSGTAQALATEVARAKAAEDANALADTSRASVQANKDAAQDSADVALQTALNSKLPIADLPKWETLSSTSVGTTTFTYTFPTAYKAAPFVRSRDTWVGDQKIEVGVGTVTTTMAQLIVKRSKGTLLLSAGPYEQAPAGTAFSIDVFGVKA